MNKFVTIFQTIFQIFKYLLKECFKGIGTVLIYIIVFIPASVMGIYECIKKDLQSSSKESLDDSDQETVNY